MVHNGLRQYIRCLNGVIAFIKPSGITSAQLCNQIRQDLLTKLGVVEVPELGSPGHIKIGHGGVLDRTAYGVLPLGFGHGCTHLKVLLAGNKKYCVVGKLGTATDTYNENGEVTENQPCDHISRESLESTLTEFTGDILQRPPAYSSLKHRGQRLSDIVRSGSSLPEVKLQPRPVHVAGVRCTRFDTPYFTLEIECGGGFYVRSLVHDLGHSLGSCAHVVDLERSQHGPFTLEDAITPFKYTATEFLEKLEQQTHKYRHLFENEVNVKNNVNNTKRKRWKNIKRKSININCE